MGEKVENIINNIVINLYDDWMITRIIGIITQRYKNVESLYCTPETNITTVILYVNYT